jgi:GT2 family glycosyltransferase
MHQHPKISIVCYVGDHPLLPEMLAALAVQNVAPEDYEVVVVDYNELSQSTPDAARSVESANRAPHLTLQYHVLANGSRAKAINAGVRLARADLIVLLADDFLPDPGLVSAHLRFHEQHPEPSLVGIGSGKFPAHLCACAFRRWLEDSGTLFGVSFTQTAREWPDHFFYAANTSFKKAFFNPVGGFDEDFPHPAWDDYEMGLRLRKNGMRSLPVPQAVASHEHAVTLDERCAAMREAAASAVILEGKYPGAQPWQAQCRTAPWRFRATGAARRLQNRLSGRQSDLDIYYQQMITASFVAAYRDAKKD